MLTLPVKPDQQKGEKKQQPMALRQLSLFSKKEGDSLFCEIPFLLYFPYCEVTAWSECRYILFRNHHAGALAYVSSRL